MPTATRGEPPVFTNAGRRFPPEVLTDAEVRALMDACGDGLPSCHRNRALIALLYRGGLRVSEALALYPKDLDAASGAVRVLNGQGGVGRRGSTRGVPRNSSAGGSGTRSP
ncbi:MAG: tyrosine-type recombinase/integrase [Phycisphaerales bacterium]|nr:tyrosine-type recombinase/integrase [Phycisphaerales bacterium]